MVLSDNGMESYVFPVADLNGAAKPEQSKTVNITANGTQTVTPDSGKVLSSVVINTNVPAPVVQTQEKSVEITQNGSSEVTPDEGMYLSKVNISVNVAASGGNKLSELVDRSITTVTADDLAGITSIGDYAFYYCASLTSVTIPAGVTSILNNVFSFCDSLTSITIPDSVTSIGQYAFYHCGGLTSITIPASVTSIGSHAFGYCLGLTSITIHSGLTSIGQYMFQGCDSLTSITIPDSVTSIGNSAFVYCESLTSITIPASVTSIGTRALQIGTGENKATITMLSTTPPTIQSSTFNTSYLNQIIVPAGCGDAYKAATNWSSFASKIVEATA